MHVLLRRVTRRVEGFNGDIYTATHCDGKLFAICFLLRLIQSAS